MTYLYGFTVALFLTIALIPLFMRISSKLRLVDDPTADRKVHEKAMPRTGGLAIILGSFLPLLFLLDYDKSLIYLFFGCGVIILFGLIDDRIELNFKWKLLGQSLGVILALCGGLVFHRLPFFGLSDAPAWLSYSITFLFFIGVVNGVNFSDGLDGLAAGTSIMALLLIFALAIQSENFSVAIISITIVGGLLGFLRYNTYPAHIFMGDSGSQFLGFIIASLAVIVTQSETSPFGSMLPVLILGIPIMDIIQVVPVRIAKNLPLPGPDQEHFHHQVWKLGFRHYEVVAIIYVLQSVLMMAAFTLRYESDFLVSLFYTCFVVVSLSPILLGQLIGWQFREKYRRGDGFERRNKLLRRMTWFYKNSAKIVSISLSFFYIFLGWQLRASSESTAGLAVGVVVIAIIGLFSCHRRPKLACRFILYGGSVLFSFLIAQFSSDGKLENWVNIYLFGLLVTLVLSIRMSRKDDFSLTTQDLLILLAVILMPLLPFSALDQYSISKMMLTMAILIYSSEFLLSRGVRTVAVAAVGQAVGLLLIGFFGLFNLS